MVLVFGFAAAPTGSRPTRIVAVTVIQPFAARAVTCAEDADATVAVVGAAGTSAVTAAAAQMTARWVGFMTWCSSPVVAIAHHQAGAVRRVSLATPAGWTCQQ